MVTPGQVPDSDSMLLRVRDLRIASSAMEAVRSAWLEIERGRIGAVVGESGSGKSMLAYALMGLLPRGFSVCGGSAVLRVQGGETDLATLRGNEWRRIRGHQAAMIFQEPMTSLNPVLTVGAQVLEAVREPASRRARLEASLTAMRSAGLKEPEALVRSYPHELSGGMRQRVMIAIALACRPRLLIADEPTTALDVTVQAEVLETIRGLAASHGLGVLLITHDLGLVGKYADTVMVMRDGVTLECGPTREVLERPGHLYTRGLLAARPSLHERRAGAAELPAVGMEAAGGTLETVGPGHLVRNCAMRGAS